MKDAPYQLGDDIHGLEIGSFGPDGQIMIKMWRTEIVPGLEVFRYGFAVSLDDEEVTDLIGGIMRASISDVNEYPDYQETRD